MGFFRKREDKNGQGTGAGRSFARTYDKEKVKPAIRCSICTGEQVAGFLNKRSGRYHRGCGKVLLNTALHRVNKRLTNSFSNSRYNSCRVQLEAELIGIIYRNLRR